MMKFIIILNLTKMLHKEAYLPTSNFEMSMTVCNPIMFVPEYACFDQLVL